jgi:hypothetical protein
MCMLTKPVRAVPTVGAAAAGDGDDEDGTAQLAAVTEQLPTPGQLAGYRLTELAFEQVPSPSSYPVS